MKVSHLVVSDSLWRHGLLAHQGPLSVESSRQEHWSGLHFTYSWLSLLCSRNEHSAVEQQYSDNIFKKEFQLQPQLSKNKYIGLPWWLSGKESTCQGKGHGFAPWAGKIPRATEHLSPYATTMGACALEPGSHSYWTQVPQLLKPRTLEPWVHKRNHCIEKLVDHS